MLTALEASFGYPVPEPKAAKSQEAEEPLAFYFCGYFFSTGRKVSKKRNSV